MHRSSLSFSRIALMPACTDHAFTDYIFLLHSFFRSPLVLFVLHCGKLNENKLLTEYHKTVNYVAQGRKNFYKSLWKLFKVLYKKKLQPVAVFGQVNKKLHKHSNNTSVNPKDTPVPLVRLSHLLKCRLSFQISNYS